MTSHGNPDPLDLIRQRAGDIKDRARYEREDTEANRDIAMLADCVGAMAVILKHMQKGAECAPQP